jgi:hypothetical protein
MRFPGPPAFILALLILTVSTPLSIYLLALPKQSQPKRPQGVDVLDAAINELLGHDPLAPGRMGKTGSLLRHRMLKIIHPPMMRRLRI